MRIAIDMRPLQSSSRFRGIGTLVRKLVEALSAIESEHEFALIYANSTKPTDSDFQYPKNFKKLVINCELEGFSSLIMNWTHGNKHLLRMLNDFSANIYLCTTFAEMWIPPAPHFAHTITWVYDLIFFKYKKQYVRTPREFLKKNLWNRKLERITKSDAILTISESTVKDIADFIPEFRKRTYVIPLGVDKRFFEPILEKVNAALNLPDKYILYVGGIDPRKNLRRALEAYASVLSSIDLPPIAIAGKMDNSHPDYKKLMQIIAKLKLDKKIIFCGFVSDGQLPAVYASAEFLLFPSLDEGFGLPVLEAMAAGCPVLTSNTSSMPEVADNAAMLINPISVDEIANGIATLISDANLRKKLSILGIERAKLFTWASSARKVLQIIEST